jgi:hypothetical protein
VFVLYFLGIGLQIPFNTVMGQCCSFDENHEPTQSLNRQERSIIVESLGSFREASKSQIGVAESYNENLFERLLSKEIFLLMKKDKNVIRFLLQINEEYHIEKNPEFLRFLFRRLQEALFFDLPNSGFTDIQILLEKHKEFLSEHRPDPELSSERNTVVLLSKIGILTFLAQYIQNKLCKKSNFSKFWEGSNDDFLTWAEEELQETVELVESWKFAKKGPKEKESNSLSPKRRTGSKFSLMYSDLSLS